MGQPVIKVENLAKEYVIGACDMGQVSFREMLTSSVLAPLRRFRKLSGNVAEEERFWAVKDVSFEVQPGEVVGVIGGNGAGKSTLLKILSRITDPTEGCVAIRGRAASLLEVGTGFHPELTGRENVFLNGAILGMSRKEVETKLEEIVDFSGIDKFLDTPVKRYSSGMQVRLAFAVAAHLEPEILIVDEVLAVGDAEFQRKCLGKMGDVARGGRTVLFVSHNMGAVRSLCSRCLVMTGGRLVFDGDPSDAVANYLSDGNAGLIGRSEWIWSEKEAPGKAGINLKRVKLIGSKSTGATFRSDESVTVTIEYDQSQYLRRIDIILSLLTINGEIVFVTGDGECRRGDSFPPGHYMTSCTIPADLLNTTEYVIRLSAWGDNQQLLPFTDLKTLIIEGGDNAGPEDRRWPGVVRPKIEWQLTKTEQTDTGNSKFACTTGF
jgi:lipopolysaccharide transport system ATP-binding protein